MPSSTPEGAGSGSKPARWPAGWTSGSSTAARGSGPRTATGSSARSSASGTRENHGGVGLGLAVARGFVEAVGGDLDVEDTPGGGTTMVVRIPEVDPIGPDAGPAAETDADGSVPPAAGLPRRAGPPPPTATATASPAAPAP